MKRLLPQPMTSLTLWLAWLLLNQSTAVAQVLLGGILAIVIPIVVAPLQPLQFPRLLRPLALLRLIFMAVVEIVRSCINVGWIILSPSPAGMNSKFIRVPLDIRHPFGLAVLSCLINSTPGTVWVEVLSEGHELVLHVLDLHDEQWWIDTIKQRYERPLMQMFGEVA